MADEDFDAEIDPEIRPLVRAFNECGLETHGSCCGHRGAKRLRRGQARNCAYLMFSVRGVQELHRVVTALNDVHRRAKDILIDVMLNWDEEVNASLDRDDPERLSFEMTLRDVSTGKDRAPTTEQLAHLGTLVTRRLRKRGVGGQPRRGGRGTAAGLERHRSRRRGASSGTKGTKAPGTGQG